MIVALGMFICFIAIAAQLSIRPYIKDSTDIIQVIYILISHVN